MSCPTCDHTMQNLGVNGQRIFWCPRCGTLRSITGEHQEDDPPRWIKNATQLTFFRDRIGEKVFLKSEEREPRPA
jgi:Transcription factor zinc-finger